jgi:hypothetical protein
MTSTEAKTQLARLRDWAQEKIQAGEEPPWAWYQYMKLVETVDTIVESLDATSPRDHSPQSEEHSDGHLRLVADNDSLSIAQRRSSGTPTRLPM